MKLIILDRDGVINADSPDYIKSPEEWIPLDGSLEAIARLSKAGYTIAILTNQSGLGRGYFDHETLMLIHEKLLSAVTHAGGDVDLIRYCPHHPDDGCDCRKPKPGLFHALAKYYDISLSGVFAVGDSMRDLQAATVAGASPVLVRTGNGSKTLVNPDFDETIPVFDDLSHFARQLLGGAIDGKQ